MAANGSRSATQSGPRITAESSVACLASPERGSTTPESTSECSTAVCVVLVAHRAEDDLGFNPRAATYREIQGITRYFGRTWPTS